MEKLIDLISQQVSKAFEAAGFAPELGWVSVSARPDLCEYQCNGAMAGAKTLTRIELAPPPPEGGALSTELQRHLVY